jgi:hypothetical protein
MNWEDAILMLPINIANLILYPFIKIFDEMGKMAALIYNTVSAFINMFIDFFNAVYQFLATILTNFFPYSWVAVFLLAVALVAALRVYSFLKDVSIFGWKI